MDKESTPLREKEILEQVIEILKRRLRPKQVILFGSRAKERSGPGADFDVAVDSPRPGITAEREVREEIEGIAGLYRVDVVYLETVDKDFREIILKTGKVIYERRS